ncbi:S1 family peptidase [Lentzea sp. NPDC060358]|uniref:S1 family peptidase n=1 Tax=Lentzea sp. NPDC060358 TaxID=3347103 RepID=UPI003654DEB6
MRRTATLVAAAPAAGLALSAPAAHAEPGRLAEVLRARLGAASAGSYVDESGRLVVTVTGAAAAKTITAAGARAKVVRHSAATLAAGDVSRPGEVDPHDGTRRDIARAGTPVAGQIVGRGGSTTGFHRGEVTGLDVTVNHVDGTTATGMIGTTARVQGGDSGGPLFAGDTALGLTCGGSGDRTSGGRSFHQPVTEALRACGMTIH